MSKQNAAPDYKRHRFPPETIGHAVWLYFRFALRYRDVEELLAERGVILTDETVRQWCREFGQTYANAPRRQRPRSGDKWRLDEVFIAINGVTHYLWRAVDQEGNVLDILVQARRDALAARKFFHELLKGLQYVPRVVITDTLASYSAAKRAVLPSVEHRRHKALNNRAEHSHQPTRGRERRMRRFKSPGHAQRFLAAYGPIASHPRCAQPVDVRACKRLASVGWVAERVDGRQHERTGPPECRHGRIRQLLRKAEPELPVQRRCFPRGDAVEVRFPDGEPDLPGQDFAHQWVRRDGDRRRSQGILLEQYPDAADKARRQIGTRPRLDIQHDAQPELSTRMRQKWDEAGR